jgi:hypothetical protein
MLNKKSAKWYLFLKTTERVAKKMVNDIAEHFKKGGSTRI